MEKTTRTERWMAGTTAPRATSRRVTGVSAARLLLLVLGLPAAVRAQSDGTNSFYYIPYQGAITISGCTGPGGAVIIPDRIPDTTNGLPVTSIGGGSFMSWFKVTSVVIPDTVTNIGAMAFSECSTLTNVTVGNNVTSIGDNAFEFCPNLEMVTFGTNVTTIGRNAFAACYSLVISLPDSVTSIGSDAFDGSTNLTNVRIPAGVTNVGSGAFVNCSSLSAIAVDGMNPVYSSLDGVLFDKGRTTLLKYPEGKAGNYSIPDGVNTLAGGAFYACLSLTNLTVPESVTNLASFWSYSCVRLTTITVDTLNPCYSSVDGVMFDKNQTTLVVYPCARSGAYTVPSSVVEIGDFAFSCCGNLPSLTLSAGVASIGASAFNFCNLTTVTIPDTVTNIGASAFTYCPQLATVTIPNSITDIGEAAFGWCPALKGVYFQGNAPDSGLGVFGGSTNAIAYYLPGTTGWGPMFGGVPAEVWHPQLQTLDPSFGVRTNAFGFALNWSGGMTVVVEATTNLVNPTWVPLATNTLNGATSYFSDPEWTNCASRYYRLRRL